MPRSFLAPTLNHPHQHNLRPKTTNPEATRHLTSISEEGEPVLHAATQVKDSSIYVLDMGIQVKILDVADQMIRGLDKLTPTILSGLREGEKLREAPSRGPNENLVPSEHPRVGRPLSIPSGYCWPGAFAAGFFGLHYRGNFPSDRVNIGQLWPHHGHREQTSFHHQVT